MREIAVLPVPVFSALCNQAFRLRRDVFVIEQGVPESEEFDADDLHAFHVVAIGAGEVRGTLRVIHGESHVKLGRVVVEKSWRGQGVATAVISFAMEQHRDVRENRFYLTAQTDKVVFYQRVGFKEFGQEFLDGGIPHLAMKNY